MFAGVEWRDLPERVNVGAAAAFRGQAIMPSKLDRFLMSGWFLMPATLALLGMVWFEDEAVEAMKALFSSLGSQNVVGWLIAH